MYKIKIELLWVFLSLVIGLALAFFMVPQLILHPTNIAILHADPLQHFLGWAFYRESPWEWPITYSENIMYPVGTSLMFTDSFPLLSILLKLFSKFLPEPFVWHGTVAIINSSLMFYSGSLLLRQLRPDLIFNIIGGFFTVVSSIFIWRFFGHFSLTSQWLIIFELILILKPQIKIKQDIAYQLLLLFLSTGIHPYFTGMLVPMSIVLALKFYRQQYCSFRYATIIFIVCLLFTTVSAWFFGWFANHSSGFAEGYGYFSNNVLTFINAIHGSVLLNPLPEGPNQYEGIAYLGLGLIIPLIGIFFLWFSKKLEFDAKKYSALIILMICFFIFGVSNIIQVGQYQLPLFHMGQHSPLNHILGIFRCSGRFIWPVFYCIQFFTLITLYDLFSFNRFRQISILVVLLALQIADNSYMLREVRTLWDNYGREGSLLKSLHFTDSVWLNLKKYHIQHLFVLKDIERVDAREALTLIAYENHITINEAYLSRTSDASEQYYAQQYSRFMNGQLLDNTLYVGLNKGQYPSSYCSTLDDYVICARNIAAFSVAPARF